MRRPPTPGRPSQGQTAPPLTTVTFKADAETMQALADIEAACFRGAFNARSAAIRHAIVTMAERLNGGMQMDPAKTTVLALFDEISPTAFPFKGYVSIADLRRRVAQAGITGLLFENAVYGLSDDGILELFVSGNPAQIPPADLGHCMMRPDRTVLVTVARRAE